MDTKMTSQMVTMGYAIFFGRAPENDAVVQEKTSSNAWMVIADFICSEEFEKHILPGVFDSGRSLPHQQLAPAPTPDIVAFAEQLGCLRSAQEFSTWPEFLRHVLTTACENVARGVSSLEPNGAVAVLLRIQRLIFSIFRHMAAAPALSIPFEEFGGRLERVATQALAEAETSGREVGALRNALNDTVWRTERSYLDLSEGLATQSQRLHAALERTDELHGRLGDLSHQLDARFSGVDQKLQETAAQAIAGTAASGRELGTLRDALNDTVWRAERSFLGLAEGLADQGQRIHTALERAGLLDARVVEVKDALSEATAETRTGLAALEERLTRQDAALMDATRSWRAAEAAFEAATAEAAARHEAARKTQAEENAALEQRLLLRMEQMQAAQADEIRSLRQEVEAATAAHQAAAEQAATLATALDQLRDQMVAEQRSREAALEALSTRLGTIQESTRSTLSAELNDASAQTREAVDELRAALDDERAGRRTLDQAVAALSERLPALRDEMAGMSAETRRTVEEMVGKVGQDTEKAGAIGNALETLAARLDALQGGVDARLQSVDTACGDTRSAIAEARSVAAEADKRAEGVSKALGSVFRIFSQEIRPLGLLFPFNAEPDLAAAEQYKDVLRKLKTESVSSCTVCGSTSWMPYGFVDGFSLQRCTDCSFIFPNPRIAESELEVLYSDHYWEEHQQLNGLAGLRERLLFDYHYALPRLFLIKGFRPTGRFLDIGCAAGALVRRAQEFGYKSVGMEVNSQIAAFGQNYFNIKIITGKIETARLSRRSFDIITMFDVFEHLCNPDAVLKRIHDSLDRDGLLVIETFRTDCTDFEANPLKHPDCKPLEHVGMYREEHIDKIIERNKFNILESRYPQGRNGSRIIKIATKI